MITAGEDKEVMEVMEVKDFRDKDLVDKVVSEVKASSKEVKDLTREVRDSIKEVSNNKVVLVVLNKVGDLVNYINLYSLFNIFY